MQAESDVSIVERGPTPAPGVQRVKEATKKSRLLLDEHQKLIRLADRWERGLGVMDEYTADDLADDSDDEKQIKKAERAAERKVGKRRKERGAAASKSRGGPLLFPMLGQSQQLVCQWQ